MPATISIDTTETARGPIVTVSGEVDLATAPELDDSIDFETEAAIIAIDLSGVTFMDSTGLRSIIRAHDLAEQNGKELRVVAGNKVASLLDLTGLTTRLNVFTTRDAALGDG